MKKVLLILSSIVILAFVWVSCTKYEDKSSKKHKSEQLISYEELHSEARAFIKDHFSNYTIDKIRVKPHDSKEYYKVYFSGCSLKIEFNRNGEWQEVDGKHSPIPTSFILTEILNYITSNYPNVAIESIDKKWNGFKVELLNDVELRFDTTGKFLGVDH